MSHYLLSAALVLVSILVLLVILRKRREHRTVPDREIPAPPRSARTSPAAQRVKYRTMDGRADYAFLFEPQPDGTWRVYIDEQPGYGQRASDAHTTHRYSDGDRKYICWDSPIRTLEAARQVAALWADATQEYIRSGKRF